MSSVTKENIDKYSINFSKLVNWSLPIDLRKVKNISFLRSLVEPLRLLRVNFINFKKQAIYKVTHNSQVFSIESVLNDVFDNSNRRIYIDDSAVSKSVYIHTRPENKPVYIYGRSENKPVYIYPRGNFSPDQTDFIVYVPNAIKPGTATSRTASVPLENIELINIENRIKSIVNYYKLASKRYKIVWT